MNEKEKQKMLELLADQTLFGLSEEESAELTELKRQNPQYETDESFEIAAAAIALANSDYEKQELPVHLREKLLAEADTIFGDSKENTASPVVQKFAEPTTTQTVTETVSEPKPFGWSWLGWAFAALALIALGVNVWTTRINPNNEVVANQPPVTTPTPEPSIKEKREQLVASTSDIVKTEWKSPTNENEILGDIVWSNSKQKGYVRFNDLPVNNADEETYQLWIVDAERNEKTPVSGGVFNVAKSGEVIVPIDASLKIKKPKQFAITKEKPGGVMVSDLEKVVAVAKI